MKILAITPARGGSKGVTRKNIKPLNGKPLLFYTVSQAQKSTFITDYIINTEDNEISAYSKSLGVEVQNRPESFWYDNSFQEVDRLLKWSVLDLQAKGRFFDIIVLLYPTSPLRTVEHIDSCISLIVNDNFDSALTLRDDRSYIWKIDQNSRQCYPSNYHPQLRGPNQKEGWNQWIENKAVYAFKSELLLRTTCRIGGNIGFIPMSKLDSVDIDTIDDFNLAEKLLQY